MGNFVQAIRTGLVMAATAAVLLSLTAGAATAAANAAVTAVPGKSSVPAALTARVAACARRAADPTAAPCVPADAVSANEAGRIARDEAPGGDPIVHPYNDQLGFCTIGLGHLIRKGPCTKAIDQDWRNPQWLQDHFGFDKVDAATMRQLFNRDIAMSEAELNRLLIGELHLDLNPCQYDGLIDLFFNGGPTWFYRETALYKALKAKDFAAVPGIIEKDVPPIKNQNAKKEIEARRKQDADRFRTANCPCRIPPAAGTFSGTYDPAAHGLPGTLSWTGSVRYARYLRLGGVPDGADYELTTASVHWTWSGPPPRPNCTWTTTSGSFSTSQFSSLNGMDVVPDKYNVTLASTEEATLAYTCTGEGQFQLPVNSLWILSPAWQPYDHNGQPKGSFDADGYRFSWDLTFDIKPPAKP